jgi:hypothetical protein
MMVRCGTRPSFGVSLTVPSRLAGAPGAPRRKEVSNLDVQRLRHESVVERVVARSSLRSDPPTELEESVDWMVLLLARDSAERAGGASGGGEAELGSDPWRPWEPTISRAHRVGPLCLHCR